MAIHERATTTHNAESARKMISQPKRTGPYGTPSSARRGPGQNALDGVILHVLGLHERAACKTVAIRVELEYAADLTARSYTHNAGLAGVLSKFGGAGLHFP